jgi:hypothetical protein
MSAFFLYIHKKNPLDQETLNVLARKINLFPLAHASMYSEDHLQLVSTVHKSDCLRIFKEPTRNLTFFLQGNIFESIKGIRKIDESSEEYALKNQLIKLYLEKGISACVGLNGIYNLVVWNHQLHSLEIAGDRQGIFQLFSVSLGNDRFILTSDMSLLKLIPGYTPQMDQRGLFDILYMGTAFEGRTVLRGVERLLPNACYQLTAKGLCLLEKFRLPFSRDRWHRSTPEITEELEYFYTLAIKRQLNEKQKLICMHSGGKDSRLFSYHLKKANIIPQCVTIGEKHHAEVFLAKQVNEALKLPWKRIDVTPEFADIYISSYLQLSNFSNRIFMPYQMNIFHDVPGEWDYLLSSFLSDPLFGECLKIATLQDYHDHLKPLENYFAFWRKTYFSKEELQNLFGIEAREFISAYEKEAYSLYHDLAEEPYQKMMAFSLRANDRFKIGAHLNYLNATCPIRLPCVDNDLMDFLFSLPLFLLYGRHLVDLYFIERSKALASIPLDQNSRKCKALAYDFRAQLNYKIWYVNQEMKLPMIRFFNPARATTQAYRQSFSLHDKGFKKIREKAYNFLPRLEGVLDINEAKKLIGKPIPKYSNHVDLGNSIRALITVAWAANTFIGQDAQ